MRTIGSARPCTITIDMSHCLWTHIIALRDCFGQQQPAKGKRPWCASCAIVCKKHQGSLQGTETREHAAVVTQRLFSAWLGSPWRLCLPYLGSLQGAGRQAAACRQTAQPSAAAAASAGEPQPLAHAEPYSAPAALPCTSMVWSMAAQTMRHSSACQCAELLVARPRCDFTDGLTRHERRQSK